MRTDCHQILRGTFDLAHRCSGWRCRRLNPPLQQQQQQRMSETPLTTTFFPTRFVETRVIHFSYKNQKIASKFKLAFYY